MLQILRLFLSNQLSNLFCILSRNSNVLEIFYFIIIFSSSSSERFKDRARVYVVNGDDVDDVGDDDDGEEEDSSAADEILKFSEKHEFEVNTYFKRILIKNKSNWLHLIGRIVILLLFLFEKFYSNLVELL
jgi:hypothetical protein